MSTTRKPKGSYSRPTTDFFIDHAMIGAVYFFPAHGLGGVVELFNNAQDGTSLHIYGLWIENEANGQYYYTRQTGTMGGTIVQSYPVVSSGAVLPGQINYGTQPGLAFPYPLPFVFPAYIVGTNDAGSQDTFQVPGPICVLVPGDSLRAIVPIASAGISSGAIGATFYWLALRDNG